LAHLLGEWLFNKVNMKGDIDVAKSTSGKTREASWYKGTNPGDQSNSKKDWVPAKFVRSELTDQEKEHVKAQNYVWDDIPEHLDALCEGGYKISISADLRNDCCAAWLSPVAEDNPNHGFVLSARGPTVLAALSVLIYKHYTKFDGVWPKDENNANLGAWG